jgi:hypothetical protein
MNINEYIEKYSKIEIDKKEGKVTITMCVPPRLVVELKSQECEESKVRRVQTIDVNKFLSEKKKLNIVSSDNMDSINNSHPNGLTATWVFSIKRNRSNKPSVKKEV